MRSCEEALELISAALDGALTSDEQTALDTHLAHCPACSTLFADLSALHTAALELDEIPAPAGFTSRVMDAIAANSVQEQTNNMISFPTGTRRAPWKKLAAWAAVVAVVALGAITLPGQLGATNMNSTADMAMPADVGAAAPESAPAEACMDAAASAQYSPAEDQDTGSAQKCALESDPMDHAADSSVPAPNNMSAHSTAAAESLSFCGVLVLTEDDLPDGLNEFTSTQMEDGSLLYTVSADYFFSCPQTSAEASLDFDFVITPEAECGLIVVYPN